MSASARKWTSAAIFAVVVGLGCWWSLHSTTDHGRGAARALAEKLTIGDASDVRTPRRREKAESETPSAEDESVETPAKPGRLMVHVVSVDDGAPVAGALVLALEGLSHEHPIATGTTDAAGAARLTIERGLNSLRQVFVRASGFVRTACDAPGSRDGGDAEISLRLVAAVALDGVALDAQTGAPLAAVRVVAFIRGDHQPGWGMHDQPYADVVTGADGTFRLDGVPPTDGASITATAEGRVPQRVHWTVDAPRRIELRLEPAGAVRGVVRDVDGRTVAGADVVARCVDMEDRRATTRGDGAYEITGLPFDRVHDVWAKFGSPPERGSAVAHGVVVTSNAPTRVQDLAFVKPARLSIRVRDGVGASVFSRNANTTVELESACNHQDFKVDDAGDVAFDVIQPGRYRLLVTSPCFLPHEETIDVEAGDVRIVDVVLDRGVVVTGVVVDDDGRPISGWGVGARRTDVPEWVRDQWDVCADDGTFVLSGCVAGAAYEVAVWGDAYRAVVEHVKAPTSGVRLVVHARGTIRFTLLGLSGVGGDSPRARLTYTRTGAERPSSDSEFVYADSKGRNEYTVCSGKFDLTIAVQGYAPVTRAVELPADGVVDLGEIPVDRGATLTGRVVDRHGGPIADATVRASVRAYDGDPVAQTDSTGAFRLLHLPAGDVTLFVAADGFAAATFQRAPAQSPVEFVLDK